MTAGDVGNDPLQEPDGFTAIAWRIVTPGLIVCFTATALSLFARHWWLADLAANLRFQWSFGLTVLGIVAALLRRLGVTLVCLLVIMLQMPWFRSSTVPASASPEGLTVTTANVYTRNGRHSHIVAELRRHDADVIVIVELSSSLADYLNRELGDEYPYRLFEPSDNGNFGIGLLSRLKRNDGRIIQFGNPTLPAIDFATTVDGHELRLLGIHTLPPMGARGFQHRNRYLNQVAMAVRENRTRDPKTSIIVAGDLNLTPWSPFFHDFCNDAGLQPFVGSVWKPTWYRFQTHPFGLVLDHVLTTSDLECAARTVGDNVGSDHRFVTHVLSVKQMLQPTEVSND